jgi:predicted AAA+ superfamily ATPase
LGISSGELATHPKVGSSWEGFALEEVIRHYQFDREDCYFWRTHDGAELDLLVCKDGKKTGFEFKYGHLVKTTPSMHFALGDLKLDSLTVIIPGEKNYKLTNNIVVRGLNNMTAQR